MNITVFLASSKGNRIDIQQSLSELASWIGENGHTLVYGGSEIGLMGILAHGVKDSGGRVIGVEPQFFVDRGLVYADSDELIVTEGMADRKEKMIGMADVIIAFPGGAGTLEEFGQTISMLNLDMKDCTCIVYNVGSYYDHLEKQLDVMVDSGLYQRSKREQIHFAKDLQEMIQILDN